MSELFESSKIAYCHSKDVNEACNNPVIESALELLCMPHPIGLIINPLIKTSQKLHEQSMIKKRDKFLDVIMQPGEKIITQKIKDVDFIMEFIQLYECVMKIRSEDKIVRLANLFKNLICLPEEPNYDEYEEYKLKVIGLSDRETLVLALLFKERALPPHLKDANVNLKSNELWDMFLEEARVELDLDAEDITSIVSGITRTGFCKERIAPDKGVNNIVYEVTPYFKRLYSIYN